MTSDTETWVVRMLDGGDETYGPLASEEECYALAAKVSQEPNDWEPVKLIHPSNA